MAAGLDYASCWLPPQHPSLKIAQVTPLARQASREKVFKLPSWTAAAPETSGAFRSTLVVVLIRYVVPVAAEDLQRVRGLGIGPGGSEFPLPKSFK